jgi:hypothetical protein
MLQTLVMSIMSFHFRLNCAAACGAFREEGSVA